MAENVAYLVSRFGNHTQTIITAHLAHVSKSENMTIDYQYPPTGYYLDQKYKSQYHVVALLAGEGQMLAHKPIGYETVWDTCSVSKPINNSLEQACYDTGIPQFYMNDLTGDWIKKIAYLRVLGRIWYPLQFSCVSLPDEFDSFVFFRNVTPITQELNPNLNPDKRK